MGDNVIQFRNTKKSVPNVNSVDDFIQNGLMPWAQANGVDLNSMKFKHAAAGVMGCLQGMVLDV